jgi:hypothetical protein
MASTFFLCLNNNKIKNNPLTLPSVILHHAIRTQAPRPPFEKLMLFYLV